jgi:hypothetical protein
MSHLRRSKDFGRYVIFYLFFKNGCLLSADTHTEGLSKSPVVSYQLFEKNIDKLKKGLTDIVCMCHCTWS